MNEWIWINGKVMPLADATVSVEDRGYQFADGVYEVIRFYHGRPFTLSPHLDRLERSAVGVRIAMPMEREDLTGQITQLIERSGLCDGMVYLQLSRGTAPRNHAFPRVAPTLLFYTRQLPPLPAPEAVAPVKLLSVPDERWKRCWIKSIALLANVLAKNAALEAGCDEAVFVDDGVVSECSASNLHAILGGRLVTHPVGPKVLPGITRKVLLECAADLGIEVDERAMTEREAMGADELFITSTTRELAPVASWNSRAIARRGDLALQLHRAFRKRVDDETNAPEPADALATAGV